MKPVNRFFTFLPSFLFITALAIMLAGCSEKDSLLPLSENDLQQAGLNTLPSESEGGEFSTFDAGESADGNDPSVYPGWDPKLGPVNCAADLKETAPIGAYEGERAYRVSLPRCYQVVGVQVQGVQYVDRLKLYYLTDTGELRATLIGGRETDNPWQEPVFWPYGVDLLGITIDYGLFKINGIRFHFSNGKSSRRFGGPKGPNLESQYIPPGSMHAGFFGRTDFYLHSIGQYYRMKQ